LRLPDRETTSGIPAGWTQVIADDEEYEANFVKVAVNVMRRPGLEDNELHRVLRDWFGADAGLPGTTHHVRFEPREDGWHLAAKGRAPASSDLVLWESYERAKLPPLFDLEYKAPIWNQGFVPQPPHIFLFVTLDKSDHPAEHQYADRFLSPTDFEWVSQNRTAQDSKHGRMIRRHREQNLKVLLFVRKHAKALGKAAEFIYCGELDYISWKGNRPITVRWKLRDALPPHIFEHLGST
jgi:hypothetical protein